MSKDWKGPARSNDDLAICGRKTRRGMRRKSVLERGTCTNGVDTHLWVNCSCAPPPISIVASALTTTQDSEKRCPESKSGRYERSKSRDRGTSRQSRAQACIFQLPPPSTVAWFGAWLMMPMIIGPQEARAILSTLPAACLIPHSVKGPWDAWQKKPVVGSSGSPMAASAAPRLQL